MNTILSEKEYQHYVLDRLQSDNGYIVRNAEHYDRVHACDPELLFRFLHATQPKVMEELRKVHKDKLEETLLNCIEREVTKPRGSLLNLLKHGLEISHKHLQLMYTRPATSYNKELCALCEQNIFSAMEEVWASDKERVDVVVFLNGLAIMSFELKCNFAGQSYEDAIYQYRNDRAPRTRLFRFKAGVLVNFAMDLEEVYMATRLNRKDTFFLPFNRGNGVGADAGKGNPPCEGDFSVSYMWQDILRKDTVLSLISKFIFIQTKEEKDELTGKKKTKETLIFPRYHQLDVIRRLLADIAVNHTSQNYLIQHSAGSGKTNSIAWLAHRLTSLHDEQDKIIFNNVIVVTDKIVVDRQLQAAISGLEHQAGFIRCMGDNCTSRDLGMALRGNTKIIATTIQKFPFIANEVKGIEGKRFAVIIDEAHSSTAGKEMAALSMALGAGEENEDYQDQVYKELAKSGKQENVSVIAFTATPKPTTLQLFGRVNEHGQGQAFHIYSMKQAIEEGFILDVLQNYTTYKTYCELNKAIEDDPRCKSSDAKKQIGRFIALHETNIAQRIEIIVEHFRHHVLHELGGKAKALVVTDSREGAVKYRQALEKYIERKGYQDVRALVAFSGKVQVDGLEYSEAGMNGFAEKSLTREFNSDLYNVLLVANKYQTGFDQPKLCAMYITKKLKGVTAVQTLSRLNRICPPYDKKTFVLDFANTYEDIVGAFSTYYTTTLLSNSVTPSTIYDLEAQIDGYCIIDLSDIEAVAGILYPGPVDSDGKKKITWYVSKTKKAMERLGEQKHELAILLRRFVRLYEFLQQATRFDDAELHKKYRFISMLLSFINVRHPGGGFNLDGKIKAENFVQKKQDERTTSDIVSKPVISLPSVEAVRVSEEKEQLLSQILEELNSRTGKDFNRDVAIKSVLQIVDILSRSEDLRISAQNNTQQDFEQYAYFSSIDEALLSGMEHNREFFSALLNDREMKEQLLGVFSDALYRKFKDEA